MARRKLVNLKLRLVKRGGLRPTVDEVRDVLLQIADSGNVPDGWEFYGIDWGKGERLSLADIQAFVGVLGAYESKYNLNFVRN